MAARKRIPSLEQTAKALPETEIKKKEMPVSTALENTVVINGHSIEIKPTKLKYQRNRTALFYKFMELYPLAEVIAMPEGSFGDERDGDKCVLDFLIAVTDNNPYVIEYYDELTTDDVEKMLAIFRKVNRIDEKEEKQKKAEELRKAVV